MNHSHDMDLIDADLDASDTAAVILLLVLASLFGAAYMVVWALGWLSHVLG